MRNSIKEKKQVHVGGWHFCAVAGSMADTSKKGVKNRNKKWFGPERLAKEETCFGICTLVTL